VPPLPLTLVPGPCGVTPRDAAACPLATLWLSFGDVLLSADTLHVFCGSALDLAQRLTAPSRSGFGVSLDADGSTVVVAGALVAPPQGSISASCVTVFRTRTWNATLLCPSAGLPLPTGPAPMTVIAGQRVLLHGGVVTMTTNSVMGPVGLVDAVTLVPRPLTDDQLDLVYARGSLVHYAVDPYSAPLLVSVMDCGGPGPQAALPSSLPSPSPLPSFPQASPLPTGSPGPNGSVGAVHVLEQCM
jgi:hypothetical protein